ncbi:MAG: hypothetical protein V7L13_23875 [Nostoc sp.]|uniref:hypothetical protein n=1 Tax=Nostoc sp. TaxID=1180 RepID=UPI002FF4E7F6
MFEIASEWKLRVSQQRSASVDEDRIQIPLLAIEPDIVFTSNIIGIYVTSPSAPSNWYAAGELFQAYLVGFGSAGYAQGELIKIILNRYHIHRFTTFPSIPGESKYLLSFTPKPYLKDISLSVWEYVGENQGTTLESLEASVKATHQRVISEGAAIKALIKKLHDN